MRTFDGYDSARRMLGDRNFRAYPMGQRYRELQDRLRHDFSASIRLLERLPTFMEGPAHKAARKAMALRNEANKPLQLAEIGRFLNEFAERELQPGRTVCLFEELGKPLFVRMLLAASALQGMGPDLERLVTDFPLLFFPTTPLKRRMEINAMLAGMIAGRRDDILDDLALVVLGVYPLSGSLALSLHDVMSTHPGTRLDAIAWPERFPRSSLHFVDRVCTEATSAEGHAFAPGDRVRCMIRNEAWTQEQMRAMFFGAGAHLCLGKQISEAVWSATVARFASRPLLAETAPLTMQADEEPFRLPKRAQVRFSA